MATDNTTSANNSTQGSSVTTRTPFDNPKWKGMNMEQLHYYMALNAARREVALYQLNTVVDQYKNYEVMGGNKNSLTRRLMGSLSFLDYGVLLFKTGKKVFSIIRRLRGRDRRN